MVTWWTYGSTDNITIPQSPKTTEKVLSANHHTQKTSANNNNNDNNSNNFMWETKWNCNNYTKMTVTIKYCQKIITVCLLSQNDIGTLAVVRYTTLKPLFDCGVKGVELPVRPIRILLLPAPSKPSINTFLSWGSSACPHQQLTGITSESANIISENF